MSCLLNALNNHYDVHFGDECVYLELTHWHTRWFLLQQICYFHFLYILSVIEISELKKKSW